MLNVSVGKIQANPVRSFEIVSLFQTVEQLSPQKMVQVQLSIDSDVNGNVVAKRERIFNGLETLTVLDFSGVFVNFVERFSCFSQPADYAIHAVAVHATARAKTLS